MSNDQTSFVILKNASNFSGSLDNCDTILFVRFGLNDFPTNVMPRATVAASDPLSASGLMVVPPAPA
jgi:hypothetical protein